jgi:hypothetical protein
MTTAICKRVLHFEAGPQTHTFYACAEHRAALDKGDVICFFPMRDQPVEPLSADEQLDADAEALDCDLCREG